ncbi:putative reverse transcriptase domain-containing protein [Tanacetum coccineum]|uniref:Reverse transcriptase domain-containing protein n=1 Tax=Tanacetum coccineum TaxID=301880 RepID=A0ABQ5I751_9ASTR
MPAHFTIFITHLNNNSLYTIQTTNLHNVFRSIFYTSSDDEDEVTSELVVFAEACQAAYEASKPTIHRTLVERDHNGAHDHLVMAYFSENPHYNEKTFREHFRMSRRLFTKIVREVTDASQFFQEIYDCTGQRSISALMKCTSAVRQLAYGCVPDSLDEYLEMDATTARDSLRIFCKVVLNLYGEEFLRKPTYTDMEKLYAYHNEKHGFPGMLGSIDCTDWPWENCPVAFKAQFCRGDHGPDPFILLEAIASNDLWIWHAFFGVSGMNNDVNVLRQSSLFNDLKSGRAPDVPFMANDMPYKRGYYLTDGIYPQWSGKAICPDYFPEEQHRADDPVNRARGAKIHWGSLCISQRVAMDSQRPRAYVMNNSIALRYSTFGVVPILGVLLIAVMSSASSAVTYTSVYTDSEPGRPVAPPSPDYIPDPEEPHTPPIPQDEDKREPMFIQAHNPDYVPEPVYPEYIPLEDEHAFPAEEQPLPLVDSPAAESPGYIAKSDPEEDPEEYEDDETEDGPVDYPMDGGDDDDDDSSGDDADDRDKDDKEEEEEHLAPTDSAIIVPTVEPVSPPKRIEPIIPPPSIDISTTGARIIVRLQASISLPPEAEVEKLLAMTTPLPSPPISLSPPSAGERLARCTAPPAQSSPPPVPSPLLPSSGCPTQIQTLRISSTQALIDAVTAALPSPPLPPLPSSLYIPPPVDRRDDVLESELPPHKRLCLSSIDSKYEIVESFTARPTGGRGVDYGFVSTVDAKARRHGISKVGYGIRDTWVDPAEAVSEIAPMTVGEVNTRVTELVELHERDTRDLYALLEDAQDVWVVKEEAYASREAWAHSIGLSQATHQELQTHRDHVYAHETYIQAHQAQLQLHNTLIQTHHQVYETRFQMQQAEMAALRESDRRRQARMAETLRVMTDMRREMSDMQAELLTHREQQRRARQPEPDARIPDHQDASGDADSHI